MMGYARPDQKTRGLWQRQWARAFIFAPGASSFADAPQPIPSLATPLFTSADADSLVALVVVDGCMIFPEVKSEALRLVADRLARRAKRAAARARAASEGYYSVDDSSPPEDVLAADLPEVLDDVFDVSPFTEANVAVSATHAHSAAGGFSSHALYNVTVGGAVGETREALVYGIADALTTARSTSAETRSSPSREPRWASARAPTVRNRRTRRTRRRNARGTPRATRIVG
jgi:neutral ceramidase